LTSLIEKLTHLIINVIVVFMILLVVIVGRKRYNQEDLKKKNGLNIHKKMTPLF